MLKYLFFLYLLIVCVKSDILENCTTPINEAGQCVPINICRIHNEYLQETDKDKLMKLSNKFYAYLNKSLCGYIKFESYVCCARRHIIGNDNDQTSNGLIHYENETSSNVPPTIPISIPLLSTTEISSSTISPEDVAKLLEEISCGVVSDEKLSFGNKTELNQYPWMTLLRYETPNGLEFKCAGSLITTRYVLTAAHCVVIADKLVSVRLGEHNIDTDEDCEDDYCAPAVQDIDVDKTIIHFQYRKGTFGNDIALLRLKTEADIEKDNVKLICLPVSKKFETIKLETAIATGWGYTEKRNNLSSELLQARIPVKPISVCQNFYDGQINLTNADLCGGGINKVDTCRGDSGGPLFTPATANENQKIPLFFQIGIVSGGSTACGIVDSYTIFTKVTFYMDWILNNLSIYN